LRLAKTGELLRSDIFQIEQPTNLPAGCLGDDQRVRRGQSLQASGKVAGAVHVSRGMLEFRADPDLPSHDKNFSKDKTVILYCGSGGRAALAGKMLKDLGYERVFNLGGFKDWADSGGAVEK